MFETTTADNGFSIEMSANLDLIEQADTRMTEFLQANKIPVDSFALRILLRELLMNAVIHGSGKDDAKTVTFQVQTDDEGIAMIAEDKGEGFSIETATKPRDVLSDGGRGLALMGIYSDRVTFNDRGNRTECWKRFSRSEVGAADGA